MKTPLTFLLSLTFLFLFSGSVYGGDEDDFQDAFNAIERKDYKSAYKLWLPLAEQKNAIAQHNLGFMYHRGHGVPQDYKDAVKWYRLAGEQGYAVAQFNLGVMYEEGKGVPQDYKEAVRWYRLSAKQGDEKAQFNLGIMYAKGQGVLEDFELAHMWWTISSSNGSKDAVKNRNIIENIMSSQQIEKAQDMARNWKPKHESKSLKESKSFFEQFKEQFGIK